MLIYGCNTCLLSILRTLEVNLLSVQEHLTFFCFMYSGNNLDKRRFTSTILTHQCVNLTRLELELYIIQSFDTGEYLRNTF